MTVMRNKRRDCVAAAVAGFEKATGRKAARVEWRVTQDPATGRREERVIVSAEDPATAQAAIEAAADPAAYFDRLYGIKTDAAN